MFIRFKSGEYFLLWASIAILTSAAISADAVKEFRVSEYRGGHQIWFEAEAFDDRDEGSAKDKNRGYQLASTTKVNIPKDASGDGIVVVRGDDTIWLLYKFDISKAGGKKGTWYLWAKMLNPTNRSDWLWVLGDDGKEIPKAKPAFEVADDRVFEADPATLSWASRKTEGDVKELQNGENVMMVWWRETDMTRFLDILVWVDDIAYTPNDDDYKNAKKLVAGAAAEAQGKLPLTWGRLKTAR
jgi:hypothetical protein